ncbi:MAG TPA: Nif3-like dinuclear metal center hexameric protein [Paludibacter sp.]|nr:Nif3-like dinuclear metal center hexameric protein [Paludibacter sp.]
MNVKSICDLIEEIAPLPLQESYDNAGLLVGDPQMEVTSVLVCIDVTEEVMDEAICKGCNLIVSHHPLIFTGLKQLTGKNEVQRCVIKAVRNNVAVYAAHTNLDNVPEGVSGRMASLIGLKNMRVLQPLENKLLKLVTFVPQLHSYTVREALFQAGAGHIGNYDSCSFNAEGTGTFRANELANPFVGEIDKLHSEPELRIEVVLPDHLKQDVVAALLKVHPYEEPAYDLIPLANSWQTAGAGIVGELEEPEDELAFLNRVKTVFSLPLIRHTALTNKRIKRVALCGGAGSSFLADALKAKADIYISGDFKYHEFFNAGNKILIADIGHFESEQFTKDIFYEIITKKMPTFAVQISETKTNPINYL